MANDCSALNQELLSEKYGTEYQKIEMDGHNIIAICQDSHSSWLGGNMVVVIDGDVFFHKRHVCGNRYFDTINSIYKSGVKSGSVKPGFEQFKSVLFTNVRLIPYSQIDAIKNDHG